jgi:hypothetical protein
MPLEDLTQIDLVTQDADGKINLIITDAGITTDPVERLELLRQKLGLYATAVTGGQLANDYPNATVQDFVIRVVCMRRPLEDMLAIGEVGPIGDPAHRIPVVFDEFPEGAWSAEQTSNEDESEAGEVQGHETRAGGREAISPAGAAPLVALTPLADVAFQTAAKFLEDGQVPFFVFSLAGEQHDLFPLEGCESAEDIWPWLRRWAASTPDSVTAAVFVCQGFLEEATGERPVLLAHCFLRQEPQGIILRKDLDASHPGGGLTPVGEIQFHDSCEAIFAQAPAVADDWHPIPEPGIKKNRES